MEVLYERCCGLDVHKKTVVACLLLPGPHGQPSKEKRTFGTMTGDLLAMADWLEGSGCTHVAMESTGSYWKPVYNLLEDRFQLLLVNAQHLKSVPGRKTDMKDAEWIAQLLRHGLVRASYVPARKERELRELIRYRTSLTRERAAEINRIQKTLEGANIKLAAVATNVVGVSGRAILQAMIGGEIDPHLLAGLAHRQMQKKKPALEAALEGRMSSHQRFLLAQQLRHIDDLDATIAGLSREIEARQRPFAEAAARLMTVPGIGQRTAQLILAEIGTDMSVFPTAGHLASWAGLCPGQDESAGKRRSGRTRKGNPWLRSVLVEAAQAAGRTKTYLSEQYHRIAARRGKRRAAVAVAHSLIVIVYHILAKGRPYEDLGYRYFDERDRQRTTQRLVHRLTALGYNVSLQAPA